MTADIDAWVEAQLNRHTRYSGFLARRAGSLLDVQERLTKGEPVTETALAESKALGLQLHEGVKSLSRSRSGVDNRPQLAALVPAVQMLDDLECQLRGKCTKSTPRAPAKQGQPFGTLFGPDRAPAPAPAKAAAPPPPWRPWADEQWKPLEQHKSARLATLAWIEDGLHRRAGLRPTDIEGKHLDAAVTLREAMDIDYRRLEHPAARDAARKMMTDLNAREAELARELERTRR